MKGAQFPEFENAGFSGVGYFSSFGETSWAILDWTDARIDIRGATRRALPFHYTPSGCFYHYYNGIYYNIFNSIADQVDNRFPHYLHNVFNSMVNSDRGELSYLERTYWQHTTPGHWDNVSRGPLITSVLAVKPCTRSDWFIDFFKIRSHWIPKLNFLSTANADYSSTFPTLYSRNARRYDHFYFLTKTLYNQKTSFARSLKALKKKKRVRRDLAFLAVLNLFIDSIYLSRFNYSYSSVGRCKNILEKRLPNSLLFFRLYFYLRHLARLADHYNFLSSRRRLHKRLRPDFLRKKKISTMSKFFFSPQRTSSLYNLLCFKKAQSLFSWRYDKKMRRNNRLWFMESGSYFRSPISSIKVIRYKKTYKNRKFIFAF
jgi:hypothetical protein